MTVYRDKEEIEARVRVGEHREIIGGLWDQLGNLQLDFLKRRGLQPQHRLLDIGCGSLRAGVKFVGYLNAGNYFGTDLNRSLLEAGYEEILQAQLEAKLPRSHLIEDGAFDFSWVRDPFDYALAQSVFSHLSLDHFRQCLRNLTPAVKPGGNFFVTFFNVPDGQSAESDVTHEPGGITTHWDRDPYHHRAADLMACASSDNDWSVHFIGDWNHPRAQQMMRFTRTI